MGRLGGSGGCLSGAAGLSVVVGDHVDPTRRSRGPVRHHVLPLASHVVEELSIDGFQVSEDLLEFCQPLFGASKVERLLGLQQSQISRVVFAPRFD